MESSKCPELTHPNLERAWDIDEVSTREEVLSQEGRGLKDQLVSYHRSILDGAYVPVILSPGFRFYPEDDELIAEYLNKEINQEQAKYISMIPSVDVYKHSPDELVEKHGSLAKGQWYFFTPRDRKYLQGSRPNRAAGDGYWKATGPPTDVPLDGGRQASKRTLVFYRGKAPNGTKTRWVMHEYVSDLASSHRLGDPRLDDCVLCRIHKKSVRSAKTKKSDRSPKTKKTAARKSKKRAAARPVEIKDEGTNQNHTLQEEQHDNQQEIPYSHQAGGCNPAGQLISHPENIRAEANQSQFDDDIHGDSLEPFDGLIDSSSFDSLPYHDPPEFQNSFGFNTDHFESKAPPSRHDNHRPENASLMEVDEYLDFGTSNNFSEIPEELS